MSSEVCSNDLDVLTTAHQTQLAAPGATTTNSTIQINTVAQAGGYFITEKKQKLLSSIK